MWDREERARMYERFRQRRPTWWPENEAWPPPRRHWRGMRGRFFRRMGCLAGLVFLLAVLVTSVVLVLLANGLGLLHLSGSFSWVIPAAVGLFFLGVASFFLAARGLSRISAPFDDLVEAAERISRGDYSIQVPERGTPDVRSLVRSFNGMAAKLKLTEEQRRDLMADITHELRTPLAVIQGNMEGMLDGVYPPDEAHIRLVIEETQILSRLVEDLRTLALAESGALQLKKEPTDLAVLVGETVSAFRAQADATGVDLQVQAAETARPWNVDPERIRQVLANLIANALRYTHPGGWIRITHEVSSDGQGETALITVQDNGEGISPEILPNVFNRFVKSRDSSGTGLGLPIARHLVEAHGGTIGMESQVGEGTTVRIRLPG